MSGKELVVDDEADVRVFLAAALREAGFDVDQATDGFDAMTKVKENPPDLISLDLVMPKHSGAKFHRELSKDKNLSRIPIIIVTGHARDDLGKADLKELTMSGPGLYLEKPVRPDNYIAAVKKILGMDITPEEEASVDTTTLQNELKDMVEEADPETLKKIKDMLKKK